MSANADGNGGSGENDRPSREIAYRLFAAEFDDASVSYSESDEERAPNYVVTPSGARINRLFAVGVLTEVEHVNDDVLRGRIVDPTGAFVSYAGQYQPDEMAFLDRASPPAFVALSGKARTFQPEDSDRVFTSVRPESVSHVDAETRDRWTVSAAEATLERVGVMAAALRSGLDGGELRRVLVSAGVDESLAAGVPLAIDHYGTTPAYLAGLRRLALDALEVVAGERDSVRSLDLAPADAGDGRADLAALAADIDLEPSPDGTTPADASDIGEPEQESVPGTEPASADERVTAEESTTADESITASGSTTADESVVEDESETGPTVDDVATSGTESTEAGDVPPTTEPESGSTDPTAGSSTSESDPAAVASTAADEPGGTSQAETGGADQTETGGADRTGTEPTTPPTEEPPAEEPPTGEPSSETDSAEATGAGDGTADGVAGSSSASGDELGDFDSGSSTTTGTSTDTTTESASGSAGDVDVGDEMYELDDEEREEIEAEFGTEFSTGSEVAPAGEADIDVPSVDELEDELDADRESEAVTDEEPTSTAEPAATGEPVDEQATADESVDEQATADESVDEDATATAEDVDLESAAVEAMADLDDGDGASREAVVARLVDEYGVAPGDVEDAIESALMSGQCYEPSEDSLKAI